MNPNTRHMRPPGVHPPFRPHIQSVPKQCPWNMSNQEPRYFRPPNASSQGPYPQNGLPNFNLNRPPPSFTRPPLSFNRPPPSFNRPPPPSFNSPNPPSFNNPTSQSLNNRPPHSYNKPLPLFNRPPPPPSNQNIYKHNIFEQKTINNNLDKTFPNSQGPQQWQSQNSGQFLNQSRGGQRGSFRGRGRGNGHFNMNSGNQQKNFQHKKPQKKERVDKRDLAENNVYYCDACDRGFKTQDKYQEHVDGHTKCTYKDCPFIAAPKLVQLHMNMQHRNGFAGKIYSLESQEDIKKWREERKKQFPTAENVEKKKRLQEERIARGEVIETKDFSKMRGRGRGRDGRGRGRGKNRGRKWKDFDQTQNAEENQSDNESPPEIAGISKMPEEKKDLDKDTASKCELPGHRVPSGDEGSHGQNEQTLNNISPQTSATSSEQEPQLPTVTEVLKALSSDLPTLEVTELNNNDCSKSTTDETVSSRKRKGDRNHPVKKDHKDKKLKSQASPPQKKYTLLEKLLAPEIRRERNVILQCVHYIVKNNFFEVDASFSNTYSSKTS